MLAPFAPRFAPRLALGLAAFLSLAIALVSWRFLALGLLPAFPQMRVHIETRHLAFLAHVSAAPVALALACFQLMPRLRARRPALHRWIGRGYVASVAVGGLGALAMAPVANGGPVATLGFGLLALAWLATTAMGYAAARARATARHRRWMIRSFALTFAAVTLRLEMPLMMAAGMDYVATIRVLAFLCWVPNALVAEALLARVRTGALA
jgi:hypothetical protein